MNTPSHKNYIWTTERKADAILEWAKTPPKFNTRWIESALFYAENQDNGFSQRQETSIDNIFRQFRIEKWYQAN